MMTSVVCRLAATGLELAEMYIAAIHPEEINCGLSGIDAKAVGNAGYKEMNAWSGVCHAVLYALSSSIHFD